MTAVPAPEPFDSVRARLSRAVELLEGGDALGAAPLVEEVAQWCESARGTNLGGDAQRELQALLRRCGEAHEKLRRKLTEGAAALGTARRAAARYSR